MPYHFSRSAYVSVLYLSAWSLDFRGITLARFPHYSVVSSAMNMYSWSWRQSGLCKLQEFATCCGGRLCLTVAMPCPFWVVLQHMLEPLLCGSEEAPHGSMCMDHHTCGTVGDAAWQSTSPLTLSLCSLHLSVPQCPNFLRPFLSLLSPNNRKPSLSCSPTPHIVVSATRTLSQGAATLPVCEPDRGRPAASLGSTASGAWRCCGRPLKVAWDGVGPCRVGNWEARTYLPLTLHLRSLKVAFSLGTFTASSMVEIVWHAAGKWRKRSPPLSSLACSSGPPQHQSMCSAHGSVSVPLPWGFCLSHSPDFHSSSFFPSEKRSALLCMRRLCPTPYMWSRAVRSPLAIPAARAGTMCLSGPRQRANWLKPTKTVSFCVLFGSLSCFLESCLSEQVGLRTVMMRKGEWETEETITDEESNCIRSELWDVGKEFLSGTCYSEEGDSDGNRVQNPSSDLELLSEHLPPC